MKLGVVNSLMILLLLFHFSLVDAQFTTSIVNDEVTITGYSGTPPSDLVIPETIDGKKVVGIGISAFYNSSLASLTLPEGLRSIGDNAFARNELISVTIPDGITILNNDVFRSNELISVSLPNSLISINQRAFAYNKITSIVLPGNLHSIGDAAFDNNRLVRVIIPNSVQMLGDDAFSSNELINIELSNQLTSIGNSTFANNKILNVTIPDDVRSIGINAFTNNDITSITLPEGLEIIGEDAFSDNKIKNIQLPESLTSIGSSAFMHNNLITVEIPASVNSIGHFAFGVNPNLCSFSYEGELNLDRFIFTNCPIGQCDLDFTYMLNDDLSINYEIIRDYRGDDVDVVIPDGVTTIMSRAFTSKGIKSVKFPESLTKIYDGAFEYNELTEVILPKNLQSIGNYAFRNNSIHSIQLPEGLTTIGDMTFKNNKLSYVNIPKTVSDIGDYAFAYNPDLCSYDYTGTFVLRNKHFEDCPIGHCDSDFIYLLSYYDIEPDYTYIVGYRGTEKDISIPEGVTKIGSSAFRWKGLTNVNFPNTIQSINSSAFSDNELTHVNFPENMYHVGDYAFKNNYNLCSYFNNDRASISEFVFANCPIGHCDSDFIFQLNNDLSVNYTKLSGYRGTMQSITIPKGVVEIGREALFSKSLSEVVLPDELQEILYDAFRSNHIKNIVLPPSVSYIQDRAFEDNLLTNIVIPDNVSYLETRAFDYNPINSMTFENAVDFQGMRLPLLKGYTCYGWYENPDFTGEPVNYVSALTAGEVTYWAKRQLIEYAIDYQNTEAHEVINHPTSYNIESNAIAIDEPLPRDGYTFAGWYTDAQLTVPANLPAIPNGSVGDKTFYAAWEQATSMNHLGEDKVEVYPNPATDLIHITTDYEQVQFSLLDMVGKQRLKKTITNNSSINIKGICEPGMYIIQIYVPETKQNFTQKLIVE